MTTEHMDSITESEDLELNEDEQVVQAVVLAAAINGEPQARARVSALLDAFDEPYRTVAAVAGSRWRAEQYVDRYTLSTLLAGHALVRVVDESTVPMTPGEVVNLLFATDIQPGQVEAYIEVLESRVAEKRRAELKSQAVHLATTYAEQPRQLVAEIERFAEQASQLGEAGGGHPTELMEMIGYTRDLVERQRGSEYLGLDSGFPHFNAICNGLDTGLLVLAAPPGRGKTTFTWQVACQVAQAAQVPVVFVSMEQAKNDLRAKALARHARLQYRHILRGRLRSDEPADMERLLQAAREYALYGRYLKVIEGDEQTTVDVIERAGLSAMHKQRAERCLVVLDYLQALPLRLEDAERVTNTKDRIDLHVSALRRVARRLDSPVLAISSENRAGYSSKRLDVFKESGGIEYATDIAMILTHDKTRDPGPEAGYQALDLNIVKNRNGERGVVRYKFYAQRAEFVETERDTLPADDEE